MRVRSEARDRFVPRDDGILGALSRWRRFTCSSRRPTFRHGEERSDVAIHVVFTKLYQAYTCDQTQQEMIKP